jgi:hypothetical protein
LLKGVDGKCFNMVKKRPWWTPKGKWFIPRVCSIPIYPHVSPNISSFHPRISHSAFKSLGLRWLWFSFKSQRRDPVGVNESSAVALLLQCSHRGITVITATTRWLVDWFVATKHQRLMLTLCLLDCGPAISQLCHWQPLAAATEGLEKGLLSWANFNSFSASPASISFLQKCGPWGSVTLSTEHQKKGHIIWTPTYGGFLTGRGPPNYPYNEPLHNGL